MFSNHTLLQRVCDVGDNDALIDEVVLRWNPWIKRADDSDDDDASYTAGVETAVFLQIAVGTPREDRCRVSLSAWMAPTRLDATDMTETGFCVDECNESELVCGERTALKLRSVRARCCGNPACTKRVNIPLVIFAQWHPVKGIIKYTFVPGVGTARFTVQELDSWIERDVAAFNAKRPGALPEAPKARPKAKTPEEACAERSAQRAAKRARESDASGGSN